MAAHGQGGLLDLLLDTDFVNNNILYFCFSEPGQGGNSTAIAKARLSPDRLRLEELKVIFSQKPKVVSSAHFGCRIVESQTNGKSDGMLFLTLGDRYSQMNDAQTLNNHQGKIIRIYKDGRVPDNNPFVNRFGALPEIWSYGHRNVQGAALSPDGSLWTHEHGPQGGDEINTVLSGRNFGWPVITYGENYGGGKIGLGLTSQKGMEQPLHYWVPSIAPSGMVFLRSERYGRAWVGNLFVGSLKFAYLNRIELSQPFGGKVIQEHKLLEDLGQRIRDVRQGPDGWLYVLTDNTRGQLIRLVLK
jgi:glucose/arabinose dehydrogenase